MSGVIAEIGLPTLVISPNKTLAAQLYREFKDFFPHNAVHYFVSFYDYYQPEAYIPQLDLYIEKDSSINDDIERMRLAATSALLERDDVIVVATVSCLYGIGSPSTFKKMLIIIEKGDILKREFLLSRLVELQYERNEYEFTRGVFRVRGDIVEIFPSHWEDKAVRIEFFGEEIDRIVSFDPLTGNVITEHQRVVIYPARHFVTPRPQLERALRSIEEELEQRVAELKKQGKLLEAQRLESRTRYDLEMIRETGYCKGIENYSGHLDGRKPGERPATILDYFPEKFLTFIDESHITIPQLQGMWAGDRSRKKNLVEHGFRLPSAYDHRPLYFWEFESLLDKVIYVSATPGDYELEKSEQVVEQIIRPTGLVDPKITVKPTKGQIEDLVSEIKKRKEKNQRVLVLTLTKRTAEELSDFLSEVGIKTAYLHSEIDTFERVKILKDLRLGNIDVIVGINLLREGIDLPEVSLVAILDADREGFLRSERSLIQLIGRAARNVDGEVIMYADNITPAMKKAIEETNRRRKIQLEYNRKHGIKPQTIKKEIKDYLEIEPKKKIETLAEEISKYGDIEKQIKYLEQKMYEAAKNLEFELAAEIRDKIKELRKELEGAERK